MQFFAVLALVLIGQSFAWTVGPSSMRSARATRFSSILSATPADVINAAKATEEKFGKGSPEAMVAWSEVEEVNSASTPDMSSLDEECDITTTACEEYQTKMAQLEELLKENSKTFEKMKKLAEDVKNVPANVKMASVVPGKESHLTPYASSALQTAIAEAKAATKKFGATSPEAAVAWDNVEELSASDNSSATAPSLSDECLVDMVEACEALEELQNKVISEMHK
ncbi:hypothetical protein TrVE_jg11154 [Triparma verrucosa]|uniref:Uncharacterized protein n=1 Tax=Triparma verrucosa TaxID=1606542 RepID=A0A9W7CNH1_9STRA|nr:hypothetical protein TrVE_jg11154 [Triparma verrucosa]